MTRLLFVSVLQLFRVVEDLAVFGGEEVDVILVDLKLLQRVDQLDFLRQQQLIFQLWVDEATETGHASSVSVDIGFSLVSSCDCLSVRPLPH